MYRPLKGKATYEGRPTYTSTGKQVSRGAKLELIAEMSDNQRTQYRVALTEHSNETWMVFATELKLDESG